MGFSAGLQEVDEEAVNKALCALGMVEGRMQGVITVRFCLAEDMQAGDPDGVARCGAQGPAVCKCLARACLSEVGEYLS